MTKNVPLIPTREEWVSRQQELPPAARLSLAAAHGAEAAALEAHRKQREEAAKRLKERRAKFEADLAGALLRNGAEWLAAYRSPDIEVEGAAPFDLATTVFIPKFDAREVGVWPIYLRMSISSHDVREWGAYGTAWAVTRPGDVREFCDFGAALAYATTHPETPF